MSIWIYEQGHEDFSTNGLGSLLPARCEIKEELNGAYELELDYPIDEDGLFGLLKTGRVIKAPVPAQTTPIIRMPATTSYEVWETNAKAKVYTKKSTTLGTTVSVTVPGIDLKSKKYDVVAVRGLTENEPKTVTKWKPNGNRVLESVESGVQVSVLSKDGAWYKVTTPNGNTGWMQAASLTLVASIAARPPETIQERKIRDQLFRIYRAEKDTEAGEVRAWARHISYDLLGNVLLDCNVNDKTVAQAIAQIDASCTQADHGFTIYTDSTATITADWSRKGYLEALLDPDEGLLSLANLRLVRDNYDLLLLERSEVSRQSVSYGTNLMGVTLDINEDGIVNRIVPVGKTKDGQPLYIDEEYVDSPRNNAATIIRAKVIEYSDVAEKEAKDDEPAVTLAQAKAALIARANTDFEQGIDLPDVSVDVDFLQLGDTVEYAAYRDLDRLYLGDLITVRDDAHDVELDAEITQVDYDVLTNRYVHMSVGVTEAARTIGSMGSFMLPNGSLGGRKIALGSLDGGHLQGASISGSHIKDSAITNSHFMNGTISGSIFENGTITGSKIDASTFTNGQISGTKITDSTLTNSKFVDGTIEGSKIKNSTITGSKIDASTFTNGQISGSKIDSSTLTNIPYAQIKDLDVTGDAIFRQSVLGDGTFYLDRLIINSANIGTATIGELMVRDAQGKLHKVLIGTNGVVSSEEVKVDGQNLSNDAMMQVSQRLVWRQATQPSAPFIGMIWMDTSLTPAGKPKEILRRCTAITPSVVWEIVQSNELHTNVIDVDDNGMNILSGGNLNLLSGGAINIKNLGNTANVINMDNTGMTISSTGKLDLQSTANLNIQNGGNLNVLSGGDIEVNNGGDINVASGGKINLTSADDLMLGAQNITAFADGRIEAKASTIDLSANNSIKLAVSGGRNLIWKTSGDEGAAGRAIWSSSGLMKFAVESTYVLKGCKPTRIFGATGGYVLFYTSGLTNHPFVTGEKYTLSFYTFNLSSVTAQIISDTNVDNKVIEFGVLTPKWTKAMMSSDGLLNINYFEATGTVTGTQSSPVLYLAASAVDSYTRFYCVQLEKGTHATDWSPAPEDPASGVKTSSVEVNTNGIYMDTTGDFNVNAGVNLSIKGGSGANSIGISNNPTDNYFMWAGNANAASAPFSVKRDGSVKATKIQHEYSNSFWDMADATFPAEFPIYIPSGYTIDSVTFTFQTKKARTFAKSAASGGASTKTSKSAGGGTSGNTSIDSHTTITVNDKVAFNTTSVAAHKHVIPSPGSTQTDSAGGHYHSVPLHAHTATISGSTHIHSVPAHTHDVDIPAHTHGINYGINEKATLATSCALKVGATTIGTYSPNPSNPVEIKSYMSAGWNTVIVAPNNDARIVAFALVKLTPA